MPLPSGKKQLSTNNLPPIEEIKPIGIAKEKKKVEIKNEVKERKEPIFIDKKNKKIKPYGRKKKKIKAKDFDDRKNRVTTQKIARLFVGFIILGLFFLGIKNTYFPEQNYTKEEIRDLALTAIGSTEFPLERGAAFAEEFLTYYLNYNPTSSTNNQILSKFYDGKVDISVTNSNFPNKKTNSENFQKVLTKPILFNKTTPLDYLGIYEFNVLMSDTDGKSNVDKNQTKAHWMAFSVSVYYDKEKDALAILKDSPTLIPDYKIENNSIIPREMPLGNGEEDSESLEKMIPTIDGFISAFAKVSPKSHNEIDQYIPSNPSIDLISGFDNTVDLEKNTTDSIKKIAFKTDIENQWKIDTIVNWKSNQVTGNSSVFTSRYVMTIEKTVDDIYLVTKFKPYIYIKGE